MYYLHTRSSLIKFILKHNSSYTTFVGRVSEETNEKLLYGQTMNFENVIIALSSYVYLPTSYSAGSFCLGFPFDNKQIEFSDVIYFRQKLSVNHVGLYYTTCCVFH